MTKEEAQQLQSSIQHLGGNINLLFDKSKPMRPKISRHLKRMTYYRERFALQMKSIIDEMIDETSKDTFKERFFRYEDYKHLTRNSLYLKISQSWLYLRNELDTNGTYKQFAEMVAITRRKDGIRIQYQKDIVDNSELKAYTVLREDEQRKEYLDRLEEYLNNAKVNEELNITEIVLSEDEIQQIETSIMQLDNFIYKILPNKIWMVKTSE